MNEPDPKITPDVAKSWLDELREWRPIVKEALVLGTAIWLAITAWVNHRKLDTIENKAQTIEQKSDQAAVKADEAAVKAAEVKAVTTETRAAVTGDPKDVAAANAAKVEAIEVKNAAK